MRMKKLRERIVYTVKNGFKFGSDIALVNSDVLYTILTKVETIVKFNSRPLTHISSSPDELFLVSLLIF